MTFGNFIGGLLIAAVGFLLVWKSEWLINNLGRIPWAEQHLGTEGGSRLMYKTIGFIIIIAGFLHATNLSDAFLGWLVSSIFKSQVS